MRQNTLHRLILLAALAGYPGLAQSPSGSPWSCALGYRSTKLRPTYGTDQVLDGFALGGERRMARDWSLEGWFENLTGTENQAIDVRQTGLLLGAKRSCPCTARIQGYAHILVGWQQLHASSGPASDQRSSLALGPGLGADWFLTPRLSAMGQVDFMFTHDAGAYQRSPALTVGLRFRP